MIVANKENGPPNKIVNTKNFNFLAGDGCKSPMVHHDSNASCLESSVDREAIKAISEEDEIALIWRADVNSGRRMTPMSNENEYKLRCVDSNDSSTQNQSDIYSPLAGHTPSAIPTGKPNARGVLNKNLSSRGFYFDLDLDSDSCNSSQSKLTVQEDSKKRQQKIQFSEETRNPCADENFDEDSKRNPPGLYIAPCMSLTHIHGSTTEILPYLLISTTGDGLLEDEEYLRQSNIVFVVNCCEQTSSQGRKGTHLMEKRDFTLLYLDLKDNSTQSLTSAFEKFFPIVEKAKALQKKCLILCHSGMSRSVSLVLAYLLACEQMSLIEAFAHVKERRQMASPNPGFMAQLIQLEKSMRDSVTVDLERYKNDRFGDPLSFAVELRRSDHPKQEDFHNATSEDCAHSPSASVTIDSSSHRHLFKAAPKTPRVKKCHKRVGSDISITFNFSVDEASLLTKPHKNRLQSDISITFFEDSNNQRLNHQRNSSDMSFVLQQMSVKPTPSDSRAQNSCSPIEVSKHAIHSDSSISSDSGRERSNIKSSISGPLEDNSVSSISFRLSERSRPLSIEERKFAEEAVITKRQNSTTYFPLLQEVSSYVSSLLVCHATIGSADVTIKSPCIARRMKEDIAPHFGDISAENSFTQECEAPRNLPVPKEANIYESLVTVCTSISEMDEEGDELVDSAP